MSLACIILCASRNSGLDGKYFRVFVFCEISRCFFGVQLELVSDDLVFHYEAQDEQHICLLPTPSLHSRILS